jgi:amino acid transporter
LQWRRTLTDAPSLAVYLEYGIRFPLTGGELHYVSGGSWISSSATTIDWTGQIDHVWLRPKLLLTYMYSVMFVVLSGSQANALTFGKAVVIASTPAATKADPRLQKVFAIAIIGVICQLQAFSRINYVRFNNLFAVYKITLLTFLTVTGWCAMGGKRTASAAALGKPYGVKNLKPDFQNTSLEPYGFALAMLSIMRVFLGYENANFVL